MTGYVTRALEEWIEWHGGMGALPVMSVRRPCAIKEEDARDVAVWLDPIVEAAVQAETARLRIAVRNAQILVGDMRRNGSWDSEELEHIDRNLRIFRQALAGGAGESKGNDQTKETL